VNRGTKRQGDDSFSTPLGKRQKRLSIVNVSSLATVTQKKFAQGAFRWVDKGRYLNGVQAGEDCVVKYFKKGDVFESRFFDEDLKAVAKAAEIIHAFNQARIANKTIFLNKPDVWAETATRPDGTFARKLVEPLIEGKFIKFNSNSGHVNGANVMQALSHFSYNYTNGLYLLCDLQGGRYSECYVLTDPVILSRTGEFGVTDLGARGMSNFFFRHKCNEFCDSRWLKESYPQNFFVAKEGTAMSLSTLPMR
jgi:hypothetical protein